MSKQSDAEKALKAAQSLEKFGQLIEKAGDVDISAVLEISERVARIEEKLDEILTQVMEGNSFLVNLANVLSGENDADSTP